MIKTFRIIIWLIIIGFGIFLACTGTNLPMKDLMAYFESLQGLSEALFAIIGIWLGVVYPDVLKDLSTLKTIEDIKSKSIEFYRLVFPTLTSIVVIGLTAIIRFLYLYKDSFRIASSWIIGIKSFAIILSYCLTIGLVFALFYAVIPLATMHYMISDTSYTKKEIIERDKLVQKPQNEDD